MNIIINPPRNEWPVLLQRPELDHSTLETAVLEVLNNVKQNGDKALVELTQRFDGVLQEDIKVSDEEIAAAEQSLATAL
ncbi:MAG TPA: histidinol dehydrogenase, partial [Agriterribacter sp.]|nr:histidinol dehydrogenase [Agriterribacter sp.]